MFSPFFTILPGVAGVRLRRGAGEGMIAPSLSKNMPRAWLCGCWGASLKSSTGEKQASVPSSSLHHSSRLRLRNICSSLARICGHCDLSHCALAANTGSSISQSCTSNW
ncbi:hypothetical protein D9M70_646020 [compost metagenome]